MTRIQSILESDLKRKLHPSRIALAGRAEHVRGNDDFDRDDRGELQWKPRSGGSLVEHLRGIHLIGIQVSSNIGRENNFDRR
jgi:hypothetical protein